MVEPPIGTYACLVPDEETMKMVGRFIADNHIINGLQISDLHLTVIYSPKWDGDLKDQPICVTATVKDIITMPASDGKTVVAIDLEAPDAHRLHKDLLSKYNLSHEYPEYIAHMTVSYDGEMQASWNMAAFDKQFVFNHLHVEDLNREWTA